MLKKSMERQINPAANGVCDESCFELGKDTINLMTVANFLKRIGSKLITYKNASPPRNQALLPQRQVNCVKDVIVTRNTENFGMSRRQVIHTISDIIKGCSYVQTKNTLNCLIR